jgi:hypothetical protein
MIEELDENLLYQPQAARLFRVFSYSRSHQVNVANDIPTFTNVGLLMRKLSAKQEARSGAPLRLSPIR